MTRRVPTHVVEVVAQVGRRWMSVPRGPAVGRCASAQVSRGREGESRRGRRAPEAVATPVHPEHTRAALGYLAERRVSQVVCLQLCRRMETKKAV